MNRMITFGVGAAALTLLFIIAVTMLSPTQAPGVQDDLVQAPTALPSTIAPDETTPIPDGDYQNGMAVVPAVLPPPGRENRLCFRVYQI